MTRAPGIRFGLIREHEGSQQRAWEELSFLLAHDLDSLPQGAQLTRHGTPDGGIEFSCPAPPGKKAGTWAWQAKYLFDFKDSTFQQMGSSFKEALQRSPDLTRYVFVLPKDLPAGSRGKSAMRKWQEYVQRWTAHAAERSAAVEFIFHGHSDVLRALTLDHQSGVARYFFDVELFTPESFRSQVARSVADLGHRYDANLNVRTDVARTIGGLCLDATFRRDVEIAVGDAVVGLKRLADLLPDLIGHPSGVEASLRALAGTAQTSDLALKQGDVSPLHSLAKALTQAQLGLDGDRARLREMTDATVLRPASNSPEITVGSLVSWVAEAESKVEQALATVDGPRAIAAQRQVVLVVGPAGCGKSHSLADTAEQRVTNDVPTVLVLGQQLTVGASVSSQVLQTLAIEGQWDDFLASLQVAAQVRGAGRALLAIDAINEGAGADLWQSRIAGFMESVSKFPMIAVVLTVRDSYRRAVLPADLSPSRYALVHHPGLAGREDEALHLYAEHYGLSVPDAPALHPEFSNPLLLRSICRSARQRGHTSIPAVAVGQAWIFNGLLNDVNAQISKADVLDLEEADRVAQTAVKSIAAALVDAGSESLPLDVARSLCREIHDDQGRASRSLLRALEREGVLLREPGRDGQQERVAFTYQRMSDHLRASSLVERSPDPAALAAHLGPVLAKKMWSSTGLIEALSATVPEAYGVELVDCLEPLGPNESPTWIFAQGLVASLSWRRGETVTDRTVELIRSFVANDSIEETEWLAALIALACVPGHPLNVDYLHRRLAAMNLVERDSAWTRNTQYLWVDDANPLARTIDWLWKPDLKISEESRALAVRLMAWLLSSNSRRLRDSATKVLVLLTDHRTRLLTGLMKDFATVDDPYIRERLTAACAGHAMRLPSDDMQSPQWRESLEELVAIVRAFARDPALPRHLLIDFYASEFDAAARKRLGQTSPPESEGQDVPAWPLTAPTRKQLAARLESTDVVYLSNSPIGFDFREYTLKRGLCEDFVPPDQEQLQARRRRNASRRLATALGHLSRVTSKSPDQVLKILTARHRVRRRLNPTASSRLDRFQVHTSAALDSLRASHPDLVARARRALAEKNSKEPVRLDIDIVERWIIARVLDLGWRPTAQHANGRHHMGPPRTRGEDKIERIGKKYSWIAYYELLSILTRTCLVQRWSGSDAEPYRHPWQIHAGADIDPTVVIRGDRPAEDSATARLLARERASERDGAWWLNGFTYSISNRHLDDQDWLCDQGDLPDAHQILQVTDPEGHPWVVLESHAQWQLDRPHGKRDPHRRDMWVRSQSYLTAASDISAIRQWSLRKNWMGLWMPTPPDYGPGWFRGYPHRPSWADWYDQSISERQQFENDREPTLRDRAEPLAVEDEWERASYAPNTHNFPRCPIALATYGRNITADSDMSGKNLPTSLLPSPLLVKLLEARQTPPLDPRSRRSPGPDLRSVSSEYSWCTPDGNIVMFATDGWEWGEPSALLVRAPALSAGLERHGLAWWTWILGEKISWNHGRPTASRLDIYGAAGLDDDGLDVWSLETTFIPRDERD